MREWYANFLSVQVWFVFSYYFQLCHFPLSLFLVFFLFCFFYWPSVLSLPQQSTTVTSGLRTVCSRRGWATCCPTRTTVTFHWYPCVAVRMRCGTAWRLSAKTLFLWVNRPISGTNLGRACELSSEPWAWNQRHWCCTGAPDPQP